jgi:gas vesicle protein
LPMFFVGQFVGGAAGLVAAATVFPAPSTQE